MSLNKILSSDSIVNRCQEVLQKQLKNKTLKVGTTSIEKETTIFSILSGDNALTIHDEETSYKEVIIPFLKAPSEEIFWLGFSIILRKTTKNHFSLYHVGIRVFQGKVTDLQQRKIFRAEWMIDENSGNHAQPHWHVYKAYSETFPKSDPQPQFKEQEEVLEFGASDKTNTEIKDNLKDFHFAMASRWHKNESHANELKDLTELMNWLQGCTEYIANQLKYIS